MKASHREACSNDDGVPLSAGRQPSRFKLGRLGVLVVSLLALGARGQADEELGASLALDVPLTVAGGVVWLGGEALKGSLAPVSCRWCTPNRVEDSVARAAAWVDLSLAGGLSDVGVYGVLPVGVVGGLLLLAAHDGRLGLQVGWDVLLVLESVALAKAVEQTTKFLVGRERPFVHWLPASEKGLTAQPSDNNLSFFSGHTDFAFAVVTGGWAVARLRGYTWANTLLYVGLPLAAGVAYLRMAAGKHYLGDVLVGAVVGAAFGVLVPALHRWSRFLAPKGTTASVSLVPWGAGAMATVGWFY